MKKGKIEVDNDRDSWRQEIFLLQWRKFQCMPVHTHETACPRTVVKLWNVKVAGDNGDNDRGGLSGGHEDES